MGSTINLIIKQDETGNRDLNFGNFWKFIHTNPVISKTPNATTLIRGLVSATGIYCEVMKIYDYTPANNTGAFNNDTILNNDLILQN